MRNIREEIAEIVAREGVIAPIQHRELAGAIAWLVRRRALVPVLPGVFAGPQDVIDADIRLRALAIRMPEAILVGSAAARLSYWPTLSCDVVECAVGSFRSPQAGFRFTRRAVPPELICERGEVRFTDPALTALDLCATRQGDGIDEALRARATTLDRLHEALRLTANRRGNSERRRLLLDSRDEPWSAAERRFHRLLREAGITGWKANVAVDVDGQRYYLDVAFSRLRLAIEIDGRLHEDDRCVFEDDRVRQNRLVLHGWRVLRFTWAMLTQRPEEVLAAVRDALAAPVRG